MHFEPEGMRCRRLALHLRPSLLVASEAEPAVPLPARRLPRLLLEPAVERDRVTEELRDVRRGPELADEVREAAAVCPAAAIRLVEE